jgi:hypothetical protein
MADQNIQMEIELKKVKEDKEKKIKEIEKENE